MRKGQTSLTYLLLFLVIITIVFASFTLFFESGDRLSSTAEHVSIGGVALMDATGSSTWPVTGSGKKSLTTDASIPGLKTGIYLETSDGELCYVTEIIVEGGETTIVCDSGLTGSPDSFKLYDSYPLLVGHTICEDGACKATMGYGPDECSEDWDCSGNTTCTPHSADLNGNWVIESSELDTATEFLYADGYHCDGDSYAPGPGDQSCRPHNSDYDPQDWEIHLTELLRLIELHTLGSYHCDPNGEDGYAPDGTSGVDTDYSDDMVFLVSDKDWRAVLTLIPVTTWTESGFAEGECISWFDGCNDCWYGENGDVLCTKRYCPVMGDYECYAYAGASRPCQSGYGTADDVCVYPTLIYHEEDKAFDADSIIYFMQQYDAGKVTLAGASPDGLDALLLADRDFGAGIREADIERVQVSDYPKYWDSIDTIVYVEDDYETALMASTYASLKGAPLIIEGYNDINTTSANIICVGDVSYMCDESYTLEQLQELYVGETNTDKVILLNPNDLEIAVSENLETDKGGTVSELYSKTSLAAPILAAAKHELIITDSSNKVFLEEPDCSENPKILETFNEIKNSLSQQITEITPTLIRFVTIVASPGMIPDSKLNFCDYSHQHRIALDFEYGELNGQYAAVGRIYGLTVSDVSSNIARSLSYQPPDSLVSIASGDAYDYTLPQSAINVRDLANSIDLISSCYSQHKISFIGLISVKDSNTFVYPDRKEDNLALSIISGEDAIIEKKILSIPRMDDIIIHAFYENYMVYSEDNVVFLYDLNNDEFTRVGRLAFDYPLPPKDSVLYDSLIYYLGMYGSTSELRSFDLITGEDHRLLSFDKANAFLSKENNTLVLGLQGPAELILYDINSMTEVDRITGMDESEYINYAIFTTPETLLMYGDEKTYVYNISARTLTPLPQQITRSFSPSMYNGFLYSTKYISDGADIVRYNIKTWEEEVFISKPGRQEKPTVVGDWLVYYDDGDFSLLNLITDEESSFDYSDEYCSYQDIVSLNLKGDYSFISFNGHGSTDGWYRSINSYSIPSLDSSYSFAMACLTNNFWQGGKRTFSINFLRKGGIAYHGGVGLVYMAATHCGKQAFKKLFTGEAKTLGGIANMLRENPIDCEEFDIHFSLLGDPTLDLLG